MTDVWEDMQVCAASHGVSGVAFAMPLLASEMMPPTLYMSGGCAHPDQHPFEIAVRAGVATERTIRAEGFTPRVRAW